MSVVWLFWRRVKTSLHPSLHSPLDKNERTFKSLLLRHLSTHFALQDSLLWEQLCFSHLVLQANLSLPLFCPGKLSEMKSTWSPGPISHSQASLSHELWKVPQGPRSSTTAPSRPPPGLTNTKPSSTWGGNSLGLAQGWSSSYTTGSLVVKRLGCQAPTFFKLPSAVVISSSW